MQDEFESAFVVWCVRKSHLSLWDYECLPRVGVSEDLLTDSTVFAGSELSAKLQAVVETDLLQQNRLLVYTKPMSNVVVEEKVIEANATLKLL